MFIDDIRMPADRGFSNDMPIFRTSQDAINELAAAGCPDFISFDHDLGGEDTSMRVVNFLIEADLECGSFIPKNFTFNVHSDNPVGKANIEGKLGGYLKFRKDNA